MKRVFSTIDQSDEFLGGSFEPTRPCQRDDQAVAPRGEHRDGLPLVHCGVFGVGFAVSCRCSTDLHDVMHLDQSDRKSVV